MYEVPKIARGNSFIRVSIRYIPKREKTSRALHKRDTDLGNGLRRSIAADFYPPSKLINIINVERCGAGINMSSRLYMHIYIPAT